MGAGTNEGDYWGEAPASSLRRSCREECLIFNRSGVVNVKWSYEAGRNEVSKILDLQTAMASGDDPLIRSRHSRVVQQERKSHNTM
jgi:hypothetical protein